RRRCRILRRDLRLGLGRSALRQRAGDRLAQRISGYARDRRSLELPRDSLGARNRRLPSRLRGVTGQTARGLAATIAPPHRRQSSLDGFRGEGGERVRVLPLQGDAAVLAGEG